MIGTILNVAGIAIGAGFGLMGKRRLAPGRESLLQVLLGAFTVFYGLRLTWMSLSGSVLQVLKQLAIVVVALMLGKMTGHLLRLQKLSNALGRGASARITSPDRGGNRLADGFSASATLFCAAPLSILGALQDGLSSYFYPLAIKGFIDGLAAMGFVVIFGWGVLLAALPVLAFQGTLTLASDHFLKPFLEARNLVDPVNATGGLLVFSVALVILGLKKLELADYLPSLIWAPFLAHMFH